MRTSAYAHLRMTITASALPVQPLTSLMKALSDDTRLRIVALLGNGELCVCHITESLGISQPNASQHLKVLRDAGVVVSQRKGSWAWYQLAPQADPARSRVLRTLLDELQQAQAMAEDMQRLSTARQSAICE